MVRGGYHKRCRGEILTIKLFSENCHALSDIARFTSAIERIQCLFFPLIAIQIKELYELLTNNYVEDDDAMFRFDYSAPFLKWYAVFLFLIYVEEGEGGKSDWITSLNLLLGDFFTLDIYIRYDLGPYNRQAGIDRGILAYG